MLCVTPDMFPLLFASADTGTKVVICTMTANKSVILNNCKNLVYLAHIIDLVLFLQSNDQSSVFV